MTTNNPAYDAPGGYMRSTSPHPINSNLGKTGEIIENAGDQLLPTRIPRLGRGSKKLDQIPRLLGNRGPAS